MVMTLFFKVTKNQIIIKIIIFIDVVPTTEVPTNSTETPSESNQFRIIKIVKK